MKESIVIRYGPGVMTLAPDFIPAPAADLRRVLKWAAQSGVSDVAEILLEWCAFQRDAAQRGYALYEKEQTQTLQRIEQNMVLRRSERELLQRIKDKKSMDADIIRGNINDRTRKIQGLADCRRRELSARNGYLRTIDYIKRNEELIKRWEDQRKRISLTSPTDR